MHGNLANLASRANGKWRKSEGQQDPLSIVRSVTCQVCGDDPLMLDP